MMKGPEPKPVLPRFLHSVFVRFHETLLVDVESLAKEIVSNSDIWTNFINGLQLVQGDSAVFKTNAKASNDALLANAGSDTLTKINTITDGVTTILIQE